MFTRYKTGLDYIKMWAKGITYYDLDTYINYLSSKHCYEADNIIWC